jgi:hypothetical protein
MVGVARRRVKVVVIAAMLGTLGCFWRDFDARLIMHAELLRDQARKGVDVAVAGRFTAGGLTELLYPLGRARAFAAQVRRRVGDGPAPPVLADFERLLEAYTRLCDAIDRARRVHGGAVPASVLARPLGHVERRAAVVLARER